ncbi:ABC transporter substrate-binding protein [Pseudorhizobium flavum]|uniref:Putative hydroxymethylpyrimidine transport system substrate-binding protein n=1 Tax=Pseudorhizobium flavum TaxID=1335061 RepID=A0A7X0DD16_9HYPH|nr:ABC transporter substrate-binding protein [Pseudorhizobium flavum]MBB6180347.1 putative hydroxymethylpyrimidine transport system substrate-binding protein [Pseudorhizobium flavum]CAD6620407.1 ABC transporter ATP-binding protein [Pseudorhizobium flavum]
MRIRFLSWAVAAMLAWPVPSHAADRLTIMLEWFVNPDHAPMIVAQQKGLFEAAGLDVELIPPADPSSVPRLVAARQADVGVHYQPNLYLDHAAGLPLVRFGTLVETPLNTVTVLAEGPIKTLADLKGRKIGFSVSGFEDAMLKRMLAAEGVALDEVELVNVNFALTSSLLAGQVDATVGGFRNFELTQIRLAGGEARSFFPEEHGVPVYDELIFIAHKDLSGDDRLRRFLQAVEEASIFLTNHPDEAWSLFIAAYPDLDDELNRQAFRDTLPRFAKRPAALDRGRYEKFGAFLAESGLIDKAPTVEDLAVEIGG